MSMRNVSRPPTWLRVAGAGVPLILLLVVFSVTTQVEPLLIQVMLMLGLGGAFFPFTGLSTVAMLAVMSVTDAGLLPVAVVALSLGVLWRVTTVADRILGVALLVPLLAFRSDVVIPLWLWWLLVFPAALVVLNRKLLSDAVRRARHPGPIDRTPSRALTPAASDALHRAGWPLVATMDGLYLHSSPLPGTYAVCTRNLVFLITRLGSRLLTTTNGAAGPDLPHELAQRITSRRPDVDILVSRHQEALELVGPKAGPPSPLEDVTTAHQEEQLREAAVIEAASWKLAAGMLVSLFTRPDRLLDAGLRGRQRIQRWLEHEPAQR